MVRCAVVGASGYSGAELVGLLAGHADARIEAVCAEASAGSRWEDLHPRLRHRFRGTLIPFEPEALAGLDVVFLALPHGQSAIAAAALHGRVGHVIDLSGDLRLPDAETYRTWYGQEHPAPELLGKAAYGLPELFGCALPGAPLVACAGCYPTVAQLAVAPLLAGFDSLPGRVVVSAMSGTSGAGRKASVALSFTELADSPRPYRVGAHQHAPEMSLGMTRAAGRAVAVTFVPHLVPIPRGILASVVVDNPRGVTATEVHEALCTAYAEAPFVRVVDAAERLPAVGDVVGTNFCDVAATVDDAGGTIVVVGVIDNLVKGAAGQAVQVMNLVVGLPEETGFAPTAAAEEVGSA